MTSNEMHSLFEDAETVYVEKWLKEFEEKYEKADEIARNIGEVIIGRISPFEEVKIGLSNYNIKLNVELDKYLAKKDFIARPNSILAAIDIATLRVISLRVVEVIRADLYSKLAGGGEAFVPYYHRPDMAGLLSKPQIVVEPLLEFEYDNKLLKSGKSASLVIEPRSPVVLPKPEYVETLLGIPTGKETVPIGALTAGEEPYILGKSVATLRVPLETFFSHVFIAGTTGSGKTTFVKNITKALLGKGAAVICIDDNGDYIQAILDPVWHIHSDEEKSKEEVISEIYGGPGGLQSVTILLPLTNSLIEQNRIQSLGDLVKVYYKKYLEPQFKRIYNDLIVERVEPKGNNIAEILISFKNRNGKLVKRSIKIILYSLEFLKTFEKIIYIYPYFTEKARETLSNLINEIKSNASKTFYIVQYVKKQKIIKGKIEFNNQDLEDFRTFVGKLLICYDKIGKRNLASQLYTHEATLENMVNGLVNLIKMGIFDIKIGGQKVTESEIDESIIAGGKLTIFDLRVLEDLPAKRVLTFHFLDKILEWKFEHLEQSVVVLVDEAHRFFPKTAGEEEREYVRHVSSVLERIARLGRVRRLGLMISTHSPKDVHDIVLNLCNSKVIFRLDPAVIDVLDLPREYKDFVTKAGDRVGLFKSYALRLHYATFRTSLPVIGHFKERV